MGAPGRLGDPHYVNPRIQQHADILIESLVGHVFVVVGDAVQKIGYADLPSSGTMIRGPRAQVKLRDIPRMGAGWSTRSSAHQGICEPISIASQSHVEGSYDLGRH
jgi:hypothetical protein